MQTIPSANEKTNYFVIKPLFNDTILLKELLERVTYPVGKHDQWCQWYIMTIGSDETKEGVDEKGIEVARVFSNWLLIKTSHELIDMRIRYEKHIQELEEEIKKMDMNENV